MTSAECQSDVRGRWGETCALAYCLQEKDRLGKGQQHPPLSNGLHRGPAATLTSAEPPSPARGNKHCQLSLGKSGAVVCLVTVPLKAKNCQSCRFSEWFTTHLQTYSALRKENTAHKGRLATTIIISGAAGQKCRQVEPNHCRLGQASRFSLFFLQISKEGRTLTSRPQLPERQPAGKGSSRGCPAVPESMQVPRDCSPACSQFDPT